MPSRLITAAILLFWLTMTGWLVEREIVPMMVADASPTYQIDLADEIGSPVAFWRVSSGDKPIGTASSKVVMNDDRTIEFRSTYNFKHLNIGLVSIAILDSNLRVAEDGRLHSFSGKVEGHYLLGKLAFEMKGVVEDEAIQPRLFQDGVELKTGLIDKIDLKHQGSIVEPMLLMNRLRGLYVGQKWTSRRPDLLGSIKSELVSNLVKQGMTVPVLIAEVKADKLHWNNKEVVCHKIEYYEPGKEVTARTWVRRIDGLVLQQEASHMGFEMITQRLAN